MTEVVRVDTSGGSYDVVIGEGVLTELGDRVRAVSDASNVVLLTDSNIAEKHALHGAASLITAKFHVHDISLPPGETSKSWGMAGNVLEAIAQSGLSRNEPIVAVGGGVVGDLAGFAAGVYMRGVPFVQVPTTLLAMVDSSVGGKTGVDLAAGKNLAGVFKQPILVLADIATLSTLPDAEWKSGLAEVAKSAIISGEEFLDWLEGRASAVREGVSADTPELVRRCVEFKAGIVAADTSEVGLRECLNYGHTLGHAIEKVAGYGTYTHGQAVAEGMRFAARVAAAVIGADVEFVRRQDRLLSALGLEPLGAKLSVESLVAAMRSDKKARGGSVRMVLPKAPGEWRCVPITDELLRANLAQWAKTKREETAS